MDELSYHFPLHTVRINTTQHNRVPCVKIRQSSSWVFNYTSNAVHYLTYRTNSMRSWDDIAQFWQTATWGMKKWGKKK